MGAKKLTVAELRWLAEHEIEYEVKGGLENFSRGGFKVMENSNGTWGLWDMDARPWTEDILSTSRDEPWENQELKARFTDREEAVQALSRCPKR